MQSVIIGSNQAGQRLDKFLRKYLPEAGNGFLYKMLRKKNITLNGKRAEGKELLVQGDEVSFFFSGETFAKFSGRQAAYEQTGSVNNSPSRDNASIRLSRLKQSCLNAYRTLKGIEILYEDKHLLILNKPAGILTQKAAPGDVSLNEWMLGYLLTGDSQVQNDFETFRPSVCNRLDRNTSGIVLCGKSLPGSQALNSLIRERRLQKYYVTLCAGEITDSRTLEGYLHREAADKGRGSRVTVQKNGESFIKTAYRPLLSGKTCTLLEVELFTGKTHQIRAHLASIGHPVAGDAKYGSESLNRLFAEKYNLRHQLLHACRVVFPEKEPGVLSPLSGQSFTAPLPELFTKIINAEVSLNGNLEFERSQGIHPGGHD